MVELKLSTKKQNIQVVQDVYDLQKSKQIAERSKEKAFSLVHSVETIFTKKGSVDVIHTEKRYEPFWHISAESYMEYKRMASYAFDVKPEVRSVTINGKAFEIDGTEPICRLQGEDHCVEQYSKQITTDAVTNKDNKLGKYIEFPSRKIKETEELMGKNKVVIPAQVKASYLVRELFKELMKPIDADKVIEERIEINEIILYFRPIYAFEFKNSGKGQTGVLEVDAFTGDIKKGKVFKTELKELISEDILFDLGAELVETVIPGVGVGVAIGKKLKKRHDKKKKVKAMESSKNAMASHKNKKKSSRLKLK